MIRRNFSARFAKYRGQIAVFNNAADEQVTLFNAVALPVRLCSVINLQRQKQTVKIGNNVARLAVGFAFRLLNVIAHLNDRTAAGDVDGRPEQLSVHLGNH